MRTMDVKTSKGKTVTVTVPTRDDVRNLKVGDLAPNCFGKMAKVVEIYAQADEYKGKAFACYYADFGEGSRISDSIKEDEMHYGQGWAVSMVADEMRAMERQVAEQIAAACVQP